MVLWDVICTDKLHGGSVFRLDTLFQYVCSTDEYLALSSLVRYE